MHSELLQKWVTIRGTGTAVISITQDEEEWLDVSEAADAAFWIDVREVSNSSGTPVYLYVETAPFKDEALFLAVAPAVPLAASASPIVTRSARGATSVAPLGRWLRWRVTAPGATGDWDVTFRIRVVRSKTGFFSPSHFPGCVLWLRSDLGVTLASSTTISAWADQSGLGANAQVPGAQGGTLPYSASGGINGLPSVGSLANTNVFTGVFAAALGTAHTLFAVNANTASANAGAFAATQTWAVDTGFALRASTTNIVGEVSNTASHIGTQTASYPGNASGGAIYSTAADTASSTVDLYINGTSQGSTAFAFTPASPGSFVVLGVAYADGVTTTPLNNVAYEFIVYNRVLSAAERVVVHRYLGGRYGISVP